MYSMLFLTMAILSFVVSCGSKNDVKKRAEREISQLFLRSIRNASDSVRFPRVPSFMKKLYKMQDRQSTFSQVSCVFSEDLKSSEKRPLFSFDLSDVKNFPEANEVKLRVFKRRSKLRNSRDFYYIHLYQIFNGNNNTSLDNKRFISSRFVRSSRGEWLAFDVKQGVNSQPNVITTTTLSFFLEVKAVKERSNSKPVSIAKYGRKQPFVLLYFRKLPEAVPTPKVQKPAELSLDQFPFGQSRFPRASTYLDSPKELCSRRESLYINFQKLGLITIIAPQGYEAYYCDGVCPIISGEPNQSLYSFLRNRFRLESRKNIPAACCVPTQLKSVMIMYFNPKGSINVSHFQGMVVSKCGCR